jgi:hypothetical protein
VELLESGGNSDLSFLVGESEMSDPLSALGVLLDKALSLGDNLSNWLCVSSLLLSVWVGKDGCVNLLVELLAGLDLVGGDAFVPLGELNGVSLLVLLLEEVHVDGDVVSEDSVSEDNSVELGLGLISVSSLSSFVGFDCLNLLGISWESLGLMWNVNSSIASSLHNSEDLGSGGSGVDTNIKESLEWSLVLDILVNVEVLSVNLGVGLVGISETDLLEKSSGEQETGGISSSVVGETSSETEVLELGGLSGAENLISSHGREDDLGDELGASSSDDKSVLSGIVLVLVLASQSTSGIEVGLSLSSSLWLDLHSH